MQLPLAAPDSTASVDAAPSREVNRTLNVSELRQALDCLQSTPLQVNVDLTGICNIHPPCVFCSGKNVGYSYRPLPAAELDRFAHYLDRCRQVNDDSFGEPLSHPEIGTTPPTARFAASRNRAWTSPA
jgi:hypothetical protein